MKTKILILIAFYSLFYSGISCQKALAYGNPNPKDSICVMSTPGLYNLASDWVREYSKINPDVKIRVSQLPFPLSANSINHKANLYLISNEYSKEFGNESSWKMVIGLDAIAPIINSKNPFLEDINQQGIAPSKIAQLFGSQEMRNWSSFFPKGQKKLINFYLTKNESIRSDIASFLKIDAQQVKGIVVDNDEEMLAAIQKDPYSIGFCKVSSIIDPKSHEIFQGIKLLPIDKNNNGEIDYNEKIYDGLNTFLRGVWIGKYSKELCSNIYLISPTKPSNENEVAFLGWILTNGQQYLNPNGFTDLANNQRLANINNLYNKEIVVKASNNRSALPIALSIIVACVVLFIAVDSTLQHLKNGKMVLVSSTHISSSLFNEGSIIVPDGLYFDKSHTWAFMEKDGVVGIGIDDFLQHITGPITRIKMKEPGEKIKKGELFLTIIQEGKQLNLKAPISGTIKTQNKKLLSNSSLINQSPYNEGWIYTIEPTNWIRDAQFLIFANGYKEWLRMEFLHLKDFLAVAIRANNAQVVFQDGGEIRDGILKDLRPEIWEDFQTHFLDTSM